MVKEEPNATGPAMPDAMENTTLFVRSLPFSATSDSLSDFFSQICPVKHSVVVTDRETKQSKGFGFVTFGLVSDAKKAIEESRTLKFEGRTLRVDLAKRRHRGGRGEGTNVEAANGDITATEGEKLKRRPRLIIRNLPWSVRDPEELTKLFSRYGKVTEALIPRKKGGRMSGFAFVTMRKRTSAERAIKEANGMKIDGRPVAVDYAVEKDTWQQHLESGLELGKERLEISDDEKSASEESEEEESDSDVSIKDEDEDSANSGDEDHLSNRSDTIDAALVKSEDDGAEHDEDEDDEEVEEEEEEDEDDDKDDDDLDDEDEDEDDGGEDDGDDIDDNDKGEAGDEDGGDKSINRASRKSGAVRKVNDTNTDTTVFIRNLSYATTSELLQEHFAANFGPVRYALPVEDKETHQPRGTGFVCFKDKQTHLACLADAPKQVSESSILIVDDVDRRYVLDNRILSITAAVDRTKAGKLAEESALKRLSAAEKGSAGKKDKRHLFLLNEGRIAPDSTLGQLISKTDMDIRQQSLAVRRQQLRSNPSLHLSLTRLAVRNIPRSMTATQLKLLARRAIVAFAEEVQAGTRQSLSKEELERSHSYDEERDIKSRKKKYGVVKQVKIISEDNKTGTGRSRGYGFIEYASHRLALMGLRWLNAREIGPKDLVQLQQEFAKADAEVAGAQNEGKSKSKKGKTGDMIKNSEDLRKRRLVVEFAIENIEVVKRRQAREARARNNATKKSEEEGGAIKGEKEKPVVAFSKAGKKGKSGGKAIGKPNIGKRKREVNDEESKSRKNVRNFKKEKRNRP
ncbi:hypothetical protein V1517DRAFT_314796 [Lipomyces orientalis]|uniref:Uncharacterized protein n=1 Tax=Lipomyces orientalis TaxID=1233043 RepID=A0ACC3TWN8_9ASCO